MPFCYMHFFVLCDCCREGSLEISEGRCVRGCTLMQNLAEKKGSFRTKTLDSVTDIKSALFL